MFTVCLLVECIERIAKLFLKIVCGLFDFIRRIISVLLSCIFIILRLLWRIFTWFASHFRTKGLCEPSDGCKIKLYKIMCTISCILLIVVGIFVVIFYSKWMDNIFAKCEKSSKTHDKSQDVDRLNKTDEKTQGLNDTNIVAPWDSLNITNMLPDLYNIKPPWDNIGTENITDIFDSFGPGNVTNMLPDLYNLQPPWNTNTEHSNHEEKTDHYNNSPSLDTNNMPENIPNFESTRDPFIEHRPDDNFGSLDNFDIDTTTQTYSEPQPDFNLGPPSPSIPNDENIVRVKETASDSKKDVNINKPSDVTTRIPQNNTMKNDVEKELTYLMEKRYQNDFNHYNALEKAARTDSYAEIQMNNMSDVKEFVKEKQSMSKVLSLLEEILTNMTSKKKFDNLRLSKVLGTNEYETPVEETTKVNSEDYIEAVDNTFIDKAADISKVNVNDL